MNELKATYRIVTPMFMGDASADTLADTIRPPTVKGALRFWWRAMNWCRIRQNVNDDAAALRTLHEEEARLFGSAVDNDTRRAGQSRFLLRTEFSPKGQPEKIWPKNGTGSGYLGLGLFESGKREKGNLTPHKEGYQENQVFSVRVRFAPDASAEQKEQLQKAMEIFGLLGGLGSRGMRRGFGSVAIEDIAGETKKLDTTDAYADALSALISNTTCGEQPPYTAITTNTRYAIMAEGSSARQVHDRIGQIYKDHRGQPSNLRGRVKVPFGLPLDGVDSEKRRASPLLFHVHPVGQAFVGIALLLPAWFHPEYQDVSYRHLESFLAKGTEIQGGMR